MVLDQKIAQGTVYSVTEERNNDQKWRQHVTVIEKLQNVSSLM